MNGSFVYCRFFLETCGTDVTHTAKASALEWARLARWTAGRRVRGWGVLGGKPTKPRAKAPRRLPRRWVRRDTGGAAGRGSVLRNLIIIFFRVWVIRNLLQWMCAYLHVAPLCAQCGPLATPMGQQRSRVQGVPNQTPMTACVGADRL